MAFNIAALAPTAIENVGIEHSLRLYTGVVALDSGAITVTLPGATTVVHADASSQTANAARVSATSGNTFTITGTGTDVVSWFAAAKAKV